MNFLTAVRTGPGGKLWIASLTRSMAKENEIMTLTHDGDAGPVELWWGPVKFVQNGDRIRCFATLAGVMVEDIEPRPMIPPPVLPALIPIAT